MGHGNYTRSIGSELISASASTPVTSAEQVWDYSMRDGGNNPRTQEDINADVADALSNIDPNAEENQNAFSNVKVGSTTIAADSKTDTLELVAGTNVTLTPDAANDKVTIAATGEANQNAFSHIAVGSDTLDAQSKTDTFELEGSGGIELSTNDVDIVTIGLDLSAAITGLSASTAAAARNDYIVAQYAGGNDANPVNNTYVRRSLANLFTALNSTDINTALGYVPYSQTSANNLAARVQTLEDTAVVKDSDGNVNINTGNVSMGKAGATIQLTGSSVKWGVSELATQYWVNNQGFVKSSGVTSVAMTVPTGLSVSGSPITTTGTLALTFASGYSIPKTADVTKGVTAYGWGDHSQAGYLGNGSMKSTTKATYDSNAVTNTQGRQYAVTPDKSGYLSVNVPWENTTYSAATTSAAGLMSASDKTKLNGIASGAEVNQNAFSNVKVGSTTIAADSKTDTLELVAGTNVTLTADATNDKVTIAATGEANQNAYSHIAVGSDTLDAQSKSDTFELEGSGGIELSTNDVDIVTIGLDLSAAITGLDSSTSAAVRTDYIVAQYAGGNSASPVNNTYYRRSIANLFKALNQSDINTALGYVPYSQTSANNLAARVQTLEDTAVVKDSSGNVAITTGNVSLGKAGATIQLTGSSVKWGVSELATQYWVNNQGFVKSSGVTSVAMTVPTGLSVSGSPITSTGTLAITLASGYAIPTASDVTKGVTAYGWGDHSQAGYLGTGSMKSTTKATYDSNAVTNTQGRQYAVTPDKSGYLSVNVPWENTTYSAATTSAAGLMSASDKTKLNGVATGAEVNQNAFSNVKVGSTTIAADSKTDTLTLVAGSNVTLTPDATNDKVTIAATGEANQNAYSHIAVGSDTLDAQSKTDTFELEGSGGIGLSTNDVDIVTIGLDLSAAITGLGSSTSAAARTDYIVAQYAGGNSASPVNNTYYRRSIANLFKALNQSDINTALGYVPYSQTSANNLAARVQTLEDTAVVKDSDGNVSINTGNVSLGKAGATIQLTGSSVKWGVSELATQYWVNNRGFAMNSVATTSADGLMSASDKTKLNGIASGAEVNQNAFSNVKVGSTTIAADSKTDTLELVAGTNVTLTADATNDKVTISASGGISSVKSLNTDNSESQSPANETISGTGTINLHKTSKTGKYDDLVMDREAATGSMGRVLLKKVSGTADYTAINNQMSGNSNTVFIVRDRFDIGTGTVTVPAGCVLKFEGGSIISSNSNGGTITGNNTAIDAELTQIFNTNVKIRGTWNVAEAYPEWFGAVGDGETNDTDAIQAAVYSFEYVKLTNTYRISTVTVPQFHTVENSTTYVLDGDGYKMQMKSVLKGGVIEVNSSSRYFVDTVNHVLVTSNSVTAKTERITTSNTMTVGTTQYYYKEITVASGNIVRLSDDDTSGYLFAYEDGTWVAQAWRTITSDSSSFKVRLARLKTAGSGYVYYDLVTSKTQIQGDFRDYNTFIKYVPSAITIAEEPSNSRRVIIENIKITTGYIGNGNRVAGGAKDSYICAGIKTESDIIDTKWNAFFMFTDVDIYGLFYGIVGNLRACRFDVSLEQCYDNIDIYGGMNIFNLLGQAGVMLNLGTQSNPVFPYEYFIYLEGSGNIINDGIYDIGSTSRNHRYLIEANNQNVINSNLAARVQTLEDTAVVKDSNGNVNINTGNVSLGKAGATIQLTGSSVRWGVSELATQYWVNNQGFVKSSGVTSVAMTVPTGLSVSGSPITSTGTLAITLASGYSIPTTAKQGQWDATKTKLDNISITKTTPSSGTTVTISTDGTAPVLEINGYGETRISSMSRPTISFNGQGSGDKGIATLSDIPSSVAALGYTNDGSNISIATDRTETDAGVSILGTSYVEITNRSGGEGIFIGRNLSGGLADVYLGNDTVEANRVASKGYVDSQVVSPAGSLIIVGEINASANKVVSFTQGGPLSSYSEYLNHNTLTFSNPNASTNLTAVIYNGSEYGTGYIHRGYAFVVTTAGTIEGTSLAVGDLAFFYNDYVNTTLNSSFKWRKM